MATQRITSATGEVKEAHSVALKVLRLSKPSLSLQHPLPQSTRTINPVASLAYPSDHGNGSFILAPVLQLPPAFGSAYVGETFSCTLCANNELSREQSDTKRISGVRIEAEMKTPTTTIALLPPPAPDTNDVKSEKTEAAETRDDLATLGAGESLQKIVSYYLKEEGAHVLAVTVTYSETGASSGRVRTFRKLYQFVSKPCMVVRTKTGVLPVMGEKRKWALEAQLENVGEDGMVLEAVSLEAKACFQTLSLNWDMLDSEMARPNPLLNMKEVHQVCFLVEEKGDLVVGTDGRLIIGQLSIEWRTKMGDRGVLSTGWLGTRLK